MTENKQIMIKKRMVRQVGSHGYISIYITKMICDPYGDGRIGDAYMVVGELPEYTVRHANQVVSMAFGMMEVATTVLSPVDNKPIKVCAFI